VTFDWTLSRVTEIMDPDSGWCSVAVEKVLNLYWALRVFEEQGVGRKHHN